MTTVIDRLAEALRKREIAVLCGAGISKHSGLPLAGEFTRFMLECLIRSPNETGLIERIINSCMPFELILEQLNYAAHSTHFLDFFREIFNDPTREPNTNHMFLARLAKKGLVHTLATTNFDILLERAFEKEGMRRERDFTTRTSPFEQQEYSPKKQRQEFVELLKLHGSADSEGPVLAFFELVSQLGAPKVIPTVERLFSTGRHKAVLIVGYSCSDSFDIIPAIRATKRDKRKEVFLVEHSDKDSVEDIGEPGKVNPFEGFKGLRIRCDTDDFVSNLRRRLGDTVGVNEVASVKTEPWRHFVQSWIASLTMAQANYVVGRLCLKAPYYGVAVQRLEKSVQLAEVRGDSELLAVSLLSMADAYLGQGNLGKCQAILQKGMRLAREIPVPAGLVGGMLFSACARRIGEVFELLKSYKDAIEWFEKGLDLEERCAFDITESLFCRAGLANAYIHISRAAEAKTYCEKLPDSYPLIRPRRLELTAAIKRAEGSPEAAMDIYERAIHSHRLVGDNIGEAKCLFLLADLAEDLGRNERAMQAFARCLDIASAAGAKLLESRTCTRLGYIAFENGNYERSVGFHQRSLRAEQEFDFRLDEGLSYMNIGSAFGKLGRYREAVEFLSKAKDILRQNAQISLLKECERNLFIALQKM